MPSRGSGLRCSFCGKTQREVKKLIAGPSVYICDECIQLCNDIIAEEVEKDERLSPSRKVPNPKEINRVLDDYIIGQERAKKTLCAQAPPSFHTWGEPGNEGAIHYANGYGHACKHTRMNTQ